MIIYIPITTKTKTIIKLHKQGYIVRFDLDENSD